jgi:hypothetical protein
MTWHSAIGHPRHLTLPPVIFSVGLCEGRCIRATPATRSARVTTPYCYCHRNHRSGHAVRVWQELDYRLDICCVTWVPTLNLCESL